MFFFKLRKIYETIFFKMDSLKTPTSPCLAKDVLLKFGKFSCYTKKIAAWKCLEIE